MDTITIVGPLSAITAIPEILGFRPRDSLVVLWVADGRVVLGQRVDVPCDPPESWGRDVIGCARFAKATAVLDVWVGEAPPILATVASVHEALDHAGFARIASIATDGERWYAEDPPFTETRSIPSSLRWVGPEREDFHVDPIPGQLLECNDATQSAQATISEKEIDRLLMSVVARVDEHVTEFGRHEALQVIDLIDDVRVRDSLLWHISQRVKRPRSAANLLAGLLRSMPPGGSRELPITCAMAYWMAGDGFRASVVLKRCLNENPHHVLGQMLAVALEVGLPPDSWIHATRETPYGDCRRHKQEPDCRPREDPCNLRTGQETQRIAPAS